MTEFYKLPDYLENDILKKYFIEFLTYYCNNKDITVVYYALRELLELSDRQWHTYELLDKEVKEQLENYLKLVIDFEDEKIMDYILCIVPRIGMGNLFDYILKHKKDIQNETVLANIDESEIEYGKNVDNPYSGMIGCMETKVKDE